MADYTKVYDGAAKDAAQSTLSGADFDTEFAAIQASDNTKVDKESNQTITGIKILSNASNEFTGTLTGNVTGNLTGDSAGTHTGPVIGNVTGNADTVTTNANLTGPVTSSGNATSISSGVITKAMMVTSTLPIMSVSTSSEYTLSASGSITWNHGLGKVPEMVRTYAVCKTAEYGFSVGDHLEIPPGLTEAVGAGESSFSLRTTSSQVLIKLGNQANPLKAIRIDTGNGIGLTSANWRLVIKAFA
jgi:hypothetical protein